MDEPPPTPTLRWTSRAELLLAAGAVLLALGVWLRSATPIFVALPFLVAPVVAALGGPRGTVVADLDWTATGAGAPVTIVGRVRGGPGVDLTDVVVHVERPGNFTETAPPRVARGPDGIRFRLAWRAPYPTIGVAEVPAISWRDPIGLVERPVTGRARPLVIERYPVELLRLGAIRLDRVRGLPGETPSHRIGVAGEFFGLRDAAPTDPPRRINWRATARAGRRLANEYELDRTGDVVLLVDTRSTGLGAATDAILLGAARAAAIGIAAAFAREKARVGYAAFGEFVDAVPLAMGRAHRLRLAEAIRQTRPARASAPSERCAATLPRYFLPGVTTVVISPLTGSADPDLVLYLRRRGYPVLVLSPSPGPVADPGGRPDPAERRLADRIERLARRQRLARVWTFAPVVDWDDLWSLGGFVNLLRRPGRPRGP